MPKLSDEPKTIELWEGFPVEVNEVLLDDFDFITDMNEAINSNDISTMVEMYMHIVGGDATYAKVREHIEKEHGHFSQDALMGVIDKINDLFPKSGNRAQRRSWKTTR